MADLDQFNWGDQPAAEKPAPVVNEDFKWVPDEGILNPQLTQGVYPREDVNNPPGGTVRDFFYPARRVVMGEGKMQFPDMPDIAQVFQPTPNQNPGRGLAVSDAMFSQGPAEAAGTQGKNALAAGLLAASDPAQVVDIARANLPGSTVRQDAMGNPIIDWQGQSYYAWKPGFRQQDANRLVAQGAAYGGAAYGGSAMGGGLLSRVLNVLGLSSGTSVGLDLAAGAAGSEQGVSLPRAIMAGVGGGVFEALSPAASIFARQLKRSPVEGGTLTLEAKRVLREQGIDPASLSAEQTAAFADMVRKAVNPEDAVRATDSATLPVPIRETRGTATLDPSTQMFENQAAEGVYGQMAGDLARGAMSEQRAGIRANVPAIQERLSGGRPIVQERGQGGAGAQAQLLAKKAKADKAVDTLYDRARATPAAVASEGVDLLAGEVNKAGGDFVRLVPEVNDMVSQLRALSEKGDASAEALFDWRSRVSKLYRSAANAQQGAGFKAILEGFDDNVGEIVNKHLLAGDEKAAQAWASAIKARRGVGKLYESKDLIADLVEREYAGGGPRLKVPPEAAANLIFGKSNLGFMNAPELGRELMRLKKVLGSNSEGWKGLREEAFTRFADQLEGAMNGGERMVSGVKFLKSWEDALRKNGHVMRSLFTEAEIGLISQFGRVAARMTNPVRGGRNYSGTSHGLAEIGKRLMGAAFMGPKGQAVMSRIFPPLYDILQTGKIARSVSSPVPLRELPRGAAATAGALGGKEVGNQLQSPSQ